MYSACVAQETAVNPFAVLRKPRKPHFPPLAHKRETIEDLILVCLSFAQMEPDARVLGSKIKRDDWTFEQDMVFEHAMAEFDETVKSASVIYKIYRINKHRVPAVMSFFVGGRSTGLVVSRFTAHRDNGYRRRKVYCFQRRVSEFVVCSILLLRWKEILTVPSW